MYTFFCFLLYTLSMKIEFCEGFSQNFSFINDNFNDIPLLIKMALLNSNTSLLPP